MHNRIIQGSIFFCIVLAFLPVVLSANYLRQDDLIMWQIWPDMKMSDTGVFYYNTVHQLVRPLCMLTFFITDLISFKLHAAVYVRLSSMLLLGSLGVLFYRWQLLFNRQRLLAATFAISALTLPPFQVFAATQNYFLIILALVLTALALFAWHAACFAPARQRQQLFFWGGNLLYFMSFLEYPLSSMLAWVMMGICYLAMLSAPDLDPRKKFFAYGIKLIIANIIFYYLVIIAVHQLFPVDMPDFRSATVYTPHIAKRLLSIVKIMAWHSHLWFWTGFQSWLKSPIVIMTVLLAAALWQVSPGKTSIASVRIKKVLQGLGLLFVLFFLAYSPIFATKDVGYTYRYAIATMPMLLYLLLWSLTTLADASRQRLLQSGVAGFCVLVAGFGVVYANIQLADGIVGPHTQDFDFIQQQLVAKALPYLKQHQKIVIHVIDCDNGISKLFPGKNPAGYHDYLSHYIYPAGVPTSFEYGMRVCQFSQFALSTVIHSLNAYGYESNYHRPNDILWNENEIIVKAVPWGDLIVNGVSDAHLEQLHYVARNTPPVITIDMREEPAYQRFGFYKKLFSRY